MSGDLLEVLQVAQQASEASFRIDARTQLGVGKVTSEL
jgi:hypothetical protein